MMVTVSVLDFFYVSPIYLANLNMIFKPQNCRINLVRMAYENEIKMKVHKSALETD